MSEDRLATLEAKVAFIMHVLALTQVQKDGTRTTKPLNVIFQEMQTNASVATPTPTAVAVPHAAGDFHAEVNAPGPDGTP
jgi:uncharacterized coiled-coil protein SlyX